MDQLPNGCQDASQSVARKARTSAGSLSFCSACRNGFLSQNPNSRFMKQELPIAITLLAIGCLPFLWQSRDASEASAAVRASTVVTPTNSSTASVLASFTSDKLNATTAMDGKAFLKQVADSFANGQSVFGDLEIENHLYKSKRKKRASSQTIEGRFWSRGMGSNQSRLELINRTSPQTMLTQVCDGRFVYRLHDPGERKIKFHSLDRLKRDDAGIIQATLPANWISHGSIDSLFGNLAEAFDFGDLKTSPDNQYVELVGAWNPDHLAKLMVNWVDHREILPTPSWSKLPPQFPHGARLRFASDGKKYSPVEVVFFKFDSENNQPTPSMSIKFGPLTEQSISSDLFRIDAETGAIDETELYNERIDLLMGNQRVAEETGDTFR